MNNNKITEVRCHLTDCTFCAGEAKEPGVLYCKHPDVKFHRNDRRCPLYRVDWASQLSAADFMNGRIKNT